MVGVPEEGCQAPSFVACPLAHVLAMALEVQVHKATSAHQMVLGSMASQQTLRISTLQGWCTAVHSSFHGFWESKLRSLCTHSIFSCPLSHLPSPRPERSICLPQPPSYQDSGLRASVFIFLCSGSWPRIPILLPLVLGAGSAGMHHPLSSVYSDNSTVGLECGSAAEHTLSMSKS